MNLISTTLVGILPLTCAILGRPAFGLQLDPIEQCCSLLTAELPDLVFRPNTTAYRDSIDSYWSIPARELSPNCVVIPKCTDDVSEILKILSPESDTQPLCQFAVRGGGHTPFQGAANIAYGITIDMQSLDNVKLNEDKSIVRVGAGNRWGNVYRTLEPNGLAAVGGGAENVGVAGYITGGGVSSFGGRHGWSADTVMNFEVVLASGNVVNANATSNTDLFQALKGGLNNFGIVTRFDISTFEHGESWSGFRSSSIEYFSETLQALVQHAEPATYDQDTMAIVNFVWNHADGWIIQNIFYHAKPEPSPVALQGFIDIPETASTLTVANLTTSARFGALGYPSENRFQFGTSTYYPDIALLDSVFEIMNRTLKSVPRDPEFTFKLSYQTLPSKMLSGSQGATPNSFGLDAGISHLMNVRIELEWADESKDFYYNSLIERCFSLADLEAKRRELYHPFMPPTCAGPWQDVTKGYGEESLDFLKQVSRKYDPNGVFQLQVPGGFKL